MVERCAESLGLPPSKLRDLRSELESSYRETALLLGLLPDPSKDDALP